MSDLALDRLTKLSKQVRAMQAGKLAYLRCPYCKSDNPPGIDTLCCQLFTKALTAVLDRHAVQDQNERASRVIEAALRN